MLGILDRGQPGRAICSCCQQATASFDVLAANVLGVDRLRIITWVKKEENIKGKLELKPSLSRAKSLHAGVAASTADVDQALEDYMNEQRKQNRGCGNKGVINKLLELKADDLDGLPATATPDDEVQFSKKLKKPDGTVPVFELFAELHIIVRRRSGWQTAEGNRLTLHMFMTFLFPQPRCCLRCSLM